MGLVLFGMMIGMSSAIACAVAGEITFWEAALIYWIMGTVSPLLHLLMLSERPVST